MTDSVCIRRMFGHVSTVGKFGSREDDLALRRSITASGSQLGGVVSDCAEAAGQTR